MSEIPEINWNHNPEGTNITVFAAVLTAVGALFTIIGIIAPFGTLTVLTPAVILLAVGIVGWFVKIAMTWWQRESRNQMVTICTAIVRDELDA